MKRIAMIAAPGASTLASAVFQKRNDTARAQRDQTILLEWNVESTILCVRRKSNGTLTKTNLARPES